RPWEYVQLLLPRSRVQCMRDLLADRAPTIDNQPADRPHPARGGAVPGDGRTLTGAMCKCRQTTRGRFGGPRVQPVTQITKVRRRALPSAFGRIGCSESPEWAMNLRERETSTRTTTAALIPNAVTGVRGVISCR